jgi:valyl-tRNA synthetase
MSTELAKTYDPAAVEPQAYQTWIEEKAFHAEPSDPGAPYSIVIPPPNVTGALHLGHAINNTLQDILTRMHRMMGDNALWIPGIDHAGIATQAVVEKQLKEQENKTRHDVGREGLVERIWQWKQQYGDRIISQLKRLGCSCDWDRTRFTLDEMCARAVRETFFKLFKDGLIYRGKRLVNWDVHLQTSISDDEIYHEKVKTNLWHIRYPICTTGFQPVTGSAHGQDARATCMVVATTRPETMLGDTAVAVHSEDPRWNWAIGKYVELPLTGRRIPIIADDILVDPKFGTGVVKVTPAHDPNDYAVWQRHQGKPDQIDLINILNPDGTLNENAGAYKGMKRDAARKKVVEELTHQGLLEKEEPYETEVGHSDRSKTPIEPYLSDQWFVKMAPLAEPALEVVRNGTIKFFPERHAQQYLSWLGEKRDWPISRQLWWGHRIPVWSGYADETETSYIEHGVTRYDAEAVRTGNVFYGMTPAQHPDDPWRWFQRAIRQSDGRWFLWRCIAPGYPEEEKRAEQKGLVQDPDVLDTWFSSALWPHSTLGWPEQTDALQKWYPTSVLLTGRDIITLWVARMVMTGMYNMGQKGRRHEGTEARREESAPPSSNPSCLSASVPSCLSREEAKAIGIPFFHVAINPTILDGKGERMSKSKGNGVDPVDIIETHGADALRFTLCTMATETQDVRMPVKKLPNGKNTSEKFDFGRNFCNKLWNAARFVLSSIATEHTESTESTESTEKTIQSSSSVSSVANSLADRWIVSRFNATITEANTALSSYRFDQYAKACYDFFWRDFCDWYVEASKPAIKDPKRAPQTAEILAAVLDGALRLMHPVIPFITETIWWRLNEVRPNRGIPGLLECPPSKRLIKAAWPKAGPIDEGAEHVFPRLQDVIGVIRNLRNEHKVDQKKTVAVHLAPPEARAVEVTNENRELIENLATCVVKTVQMNLPQPANTVRATINNCEVYVEDLVDANAEAARIAKRREELTKTIAALNGRLNNAGYIAKAPPALVEQTRQQLADAEAELKKLL